MSEGKAGPDPAFSARNRQWPLRLVGCVFGAGCWAVGFFSWFYVGGLSDLERNRAVGFALTAFVVGLVAIAGSLLARDVHALWYCSPRRWRPFKDDVIDDR